MQWKPKSRHYRATKISVGICRQWHGFLWKWCIFHKGEARFLCMACSFQNLKTSVNFKEWIFCCCSLEFFCCTLQWLLWIDFILRTKWLLHTIGWLSTCSRKFSHSSITAKYESQVCAQWQFWRDPSSSRIRILQWQINQKIYTVTMKSNSHCSQLRYL